MLSVKETTGKRKLSLALTVFILLRFVFTVGIAPFGFSLNSNEETSYFRFACMAIFSILFSFIAADVIIKVYEKLGEISLFICAYILSDSLLFNAHINTLRLVIAILGLLCVENALRDKPVIRSEIILPLYVLFSTAFVVETGLSIGVPVLFLYTISNAENFKKSKFKLITVLAIVLFGAAGVLINLKLFSQLNGNKFFADISYNYEIYTYNLKLILLFIPSAILAIWFFSIFFTKNRKKQYTNAIVDAIIIAYAAAIVGFFVLKNSAAIFAINAFVPAIILTLVRKNVPAAKYALDEINSTIKKYSAVFLLVFIFIVFLSVTLTYDLLPGVSFYGAINWLH